PERAITVTPPIFTGYLSDIEGDDPVLEDKVDLSEKGLDSEGNLDSAPETSRNASDIATISSTSQLPSLQFPVSQPPPLKRQRHAIPLRTQHELQCTERKKALTSALTDINKKLTSRKDTTFTAGREGLQASCAQAIRNYLEMVLKNGRKGMDTASQAAESHGFAEKWGGRLVRRWVKCWVEQRELPTSNRGAHTKSYTLLDNPAIRAELQLFLRSNKWAVDPGKIAEFSKSTMIPAAADKYLKNVIQEEMLCGLKKYMELELFPRIQQQVVKGISLETAQQFLHKEANDGKKKSWVMNGEQPLRKKGVGRGIHWSDVLSGVVGHMPGAGQSLEYGKNYEGYWTGELFIKQLKEKIIPEFEQLHGPAYQALFLVDNLQGHCAYAEDALLASRMNFKPGGKQACLQQGWYFNDQGEKIMQDMVFPLDHPEFLDQPKGMKQVLIELKRWLRNNCDYTFQTLQDNMPKALASVGVILIRKWQN
ncbi:hypothetical protein BJ165DRAFT_1323056, partial [Panaeolus papilionaceus]